MPSRTPPWRLDYGLLEILPRLLVGADLLLIGLAGLAVSVWWPLPYVATASLAILAAMVLAPVLLHDEAAGRAASRGAVPPLLWRHGARFGLLAALTWSMNTLAAPQSMPATWWGAWLLPALLATLGLRLGAVLAIRRLQADGLLTEAIAIVGSGSVSAGLRDRLLARRPDAVEVLGVFDANTVPALLALGQRRRIDWILLTEPYAGGPAEAAMVSRLKALSAPIGTCLGSVEPRHSPLHPAFEFDDHDLHSFLAVAARFGQERYGFVVTPNADHLVRLHEDAAFRKLYAAASFILLDSRFLARYLRLTRGLVLPVCTGSDLTAGLFTDVMAPDDCIVLVGGSAAQAQALRERHGLRRLAHHNPPMGFIRDPLAVERCLRHVESHSPFRFCLLAVGSPQQEQVAALLQEREIARGLVLCVGASLDFLTGRERRAPRWLQLCGLEWAYRLVQSPRRLASRYLLRGPRVFRLLAGRQVRLRPVTAASAAPAGHPDQTRSDLPASPRQTG